MLVDATSKLQIPYCTVVPIWMANITLYSESNWIVCFLEQTVPFKDKVDGAYERKMLRYADMVAEVRKHGWQT